MKSSRLDVATHVTVSMVIAIQDEQSGGHLRVKIEEESHDA